jgi:hypothetical protein
LFVEYPKDVALMSIFKKNKKQELLKFKEEHPNLNDVEKNLILDTVKRINELKTSQDKEILAIIHSLRNLSIYGQLSKDGRLLLKKLQRDQWLWGLLNSVVLHDGS